ncbi:MAG: cytochrome c3 family protein, partial [Phycisphaerae bacterium]
DRLAPRAAPDGDELAAAPDSVPKGVRVVKDSLARTVLHLPAEADRPGIYIKCHKLRGWPHASHATSGKRVTGRVVDPRERLKYATVANNACMNCHKIHSAPHRERLLRFRRLEENCLNCHGGAVANFSIAGEIRKRSGHDSRFRFGRHDPTEKPFTMQRHVECVDCHNPHAAFHDPIGVVQGSFGQLVKGPNQNVSGVTLGGRDIDAARFLYEICFKCHGDGVLRPRNRIRRQVTQTNTRLEFQLGNPSYHPVAGPRRNPDVVSLTPPLRVGSVITCIDCHNSDNSRYAGGSGPNGPHGSIFTPLLIRNYTTADFTTESAASYALCYGCHSRDSILNNESFPLHRFHVVDQRAPCSACHDAHGVFRGQGNRSNHGSLINFDRSIVTPADAPGGGRRIEYRDTGRFSGNCTLTCHGQAHVGFPYSRGGAPRSIVSRRSFP